jgi:large subunit ribosomal protein L29|uniref:Large ribosomal subunit protein uL29 n=1 Tax=Desulfobacca acetoxidans TaxID=60893 RepID=A0A7C5ELB0_9BACT
MKAADLRELTTEELVAKMRELQEELFKLNFQHQANRLENTARLRQSRKDLARVKTVLREKTGQKW